MVTDNCPLGYKVSRMKIIIINDVKRFHHKSTILLRLIKKKPPKNHTVVSRKYKY